MVEDLKRRVEDKVLDTYLAAEKAFGRTFPLCDIHYRDMGRTAGKASYINNSIELSPTLLATYSEKFLGRTVPHEIAHLITRILFPLARAHGKEWRSVMIKLGVQDVTRCHSYDTSVVPNVRSRDSFLYVCQNCGQEIELGATRHKRLQETRLSGAYKVWHARCGKEKGRLILRGRLCS